MIRCVLIDDESNSLEMMEWLLKTYCPQVKIEAMCNAASKGIEAINKYKPDLVFLDIEMPHMNGFDMLEQFDKLFFDVVFCTAYDQFAIKAFKYSALNYLLKPVDPEDLKETIRRIRGKKIGPSKEQIELLFQNIRQTGKTGCAAYCTYYRRRDDLCADKRYSLLPGRKQLYKCGAGRR